ncbi:hypothetical protein ACRALDRAFT_213167 [Sodiomyces alcalophilus JCM 7366]|uniref:uncharacterized protein n=1 Tax=Sodiomyces alcalophilus JCM 7366 TaxID=591952 RepID=UPI0039B4351F
MADFNMPWGNHLFGRISSGVVEFGDLRLPLLLRMFGRALSLSRQPGTQGTAALGQPTNHNWKYVKHDKQRPPSLSPLVGT